MGNDSGRKNPAATRALSLLLIFVISAGQPAHAEEVFHPQGTPLRKLERGGANLLLSGLETCYRLRQPENNSVLPPWISGIGSSIYYSCKRTLAGVYEVLTFPVPAPAGYKPALQPEFVWQYPPKRIFRKK